MARACTGKVCVSTCEALRARWERVKLGGSACNSRLRSCPCCHMDLQNKVDYSRKTDATVLGAATVTEQGLSTVARS